MSYIFDVKIAQLEKLSLFYSVWNSKVFLS